ncbi:MAG: aminotransferase class V-fold PLP-dependent enzyme [Candidatus Heimdallarchaeota archaeon]|nr:aminotransferase class V-fold PLP-dependent enzyme [Candidatus Heimdallarchaeota archaeon]
MEGIHRDDFPILQEKTYFNACSTGALATQVKKAGTQFLEDWDSYGGIAWNIEDGWTDQVEQARKLFAKLIGSKAENVAYFFGNSTAIASIMSSIPFKSNDNVIFNNLDFPAIPSNIMAQASGNLKYKVIESVNEKTVDLNQYRKAIDNKTKLVTACEVVSNTGFRIDTKELMELTSEAGIPLFLDTYQSTGTIPHDVSKTGVDFLASGCLKYLIGGFGISFLYVRDDWIETMEPLSIGWMGVDNPFEDLFNSLRTSLHRPSDARKFQFGTPYPVGAYTAVAGMKKVDSIGVNRIYKHNMNITRELIDLALDADFTLLNPTDDDKRGAIVNIQIKDAKNKAKYLQNNNFVLDARANGLRVAPHFYNNSDDIYLLFNEIQQFEK